MYFYLLLLYRQEQEFVFDIIKDVARYHEFVPFCLRSRLLPSSDEVVSQEHSEPHIFYAELSVGFNQFNESYVSKVSCYGIERVEAEAVDSSLFNHLKSSWFIVKLEDGGCKVDFYVDFEFKNYIYAYAANIFFIQVSKEMFIAFMKRVQYLDEQRAKERENAQIS